MIFLPIGLNIANKKILIIGGGKVALQKLKSLEQFTKDITIIAPRISQKIKDKGFSCFEKEYDKNDLRGYLLVYACTNNKKLNKQIKKDADELGILINVVDDSNISDFISPAIYKQNNMTVSVSSNGKNVLKTIKWRDKIKTFLKNDNS